MELTVNLSEEEYNSLLEKAKDEVRNELTVEVIEKHIKNDPFTGVIGLLRTYGIYERYNKLIKDLDNGVRYDRPFTIKDLNQNDNFIIAIYNLMYTKVN